MPRRKPTKAPTRKAKPAKSKAILDKLKEVDKPPLNDTIIKTIRRRPTLLAELEAATMASKKEIVAALEDLQSLGMNICLFGDRWSLERRPATGEQTPRTFTYTSRKDNTFVFGCSSDKHYGSKYERLDVTRDLYQWFADEGVDRVIDAGNWIEGESRFNKFDIAIHGMENQIDYLIEQLPKHDGLKTYAIHGDDHEGWYGQREAIDMGRFLEGKMKDAGREDWIDLGFVECKMDLVNANTGVKTSMMIIHPGGGSAYAVSYKPQKIVESLQGGEKPGVLIIGHYHKLSANVIRNVWALQVGCSQDQTVFLRKLGIEPHVGGMKVTLHQDPETGAIMRCVPEIQQYFVKSYYNDRFTKVNVPNLPNRTIQGV